MSKKPKPKPKPKSRSEGSARPLKLPPNVPSEALWFDAEGRQWVDVGAGEPVEDGRPAYCRDGRRLGVIVKRGQGEAQITEKVAALDAPGYLRGYGAWWRMIPNPFASNTKIASDGKSTGVVVDCAHCGKRITMTFAKSTYDVFLALNGQSVVCAECNHATVVRLPRG